MGCACGIGRGGGLGVVFDITLRVLSDLKTFKVALIVARGSLFRLYTLRLTVRRFMF